MGDPRPIVPSIVVQEEGSRKVLVYVDIPELKVKRSFPNLLKQIPSNAEQRRLDFRNQSLTFTISVQTRQHGTRVYSLSPRRLHGEIQPDRCSIKYQRGGCWITIIKLESTDWMNSICDDLNPGLDTQENDDEDDKEAAASAPPAEERQLRNTDMPPPFNLVPLAPPPAYQPRTTKAQAPTRPPTVQT